MECSGSPGVVLQETFLFCCFTVGQQCACAAVCTPVSQRFLLFADVGPETCSLRFFSSLSNTVGCCMAQTKTVFFPSPCRIQHHPTTTTPACHSLTKPASKTCTADTICSPHTTKMREHSQLVSQQHLPLTQNLGPIKQPTNSQPSKRIRRSLTACHNQPTT